MKTRPLPALDALLQGSRPKSAADPERAAMALVKVRDKVRSGRTSRSSLMYGSRLSKATVMGQVAKFGFRSDSSLLSHPATHSAYRSLKFEVEGLTVPPEQIGRVACMAFTGAAKPRRLPLNVLARQGEAAWSCRTRRCGKGCQ